MREHPSSFLWIQNGIVLHFLKFIEILVLCDGELFNSGCFVHSSSSQKMCDVYNVVVDFIVAH